MNKNKGKQNNIKINNEESSSLSAFVKRPIPSTNEVDDFEEILDKEVRHQEIDSNLNEIYRDKKGELVDVKKMKRRKRASLIVRIFKKLIIVVLIALGAYLGYLHYFTGDSDVESVQFYIDAPEEVLSGENISYEVIYKNTTKFPISDIRLELDYPDNFIFESSNPEPGLINNGFDLRDLPAGEEASVMINGRLIGFNDSVNVISGRLHYTPLNFTSEFKKESSAATIINDLGFEVDIEYPDFVFVGQKNDIILNVSNIGENNFSDFIIEFSIPKEASISLSEDQEIDSLELEKEGESTWLVSGFSDDISDININFEYIAEAKSIDSAFSTSLKQRLSDGQSYSFWDNSFDLPAMESDLNLSLFLNGSKNDQAVNFSETLNYTLNYSNKGESEINDAVIMVVLDGDILDWSSLSLGVDGEIKSGQVIWDKEDISDLAVINPGDDGEINFSINTNDYDESINNSDMSISVYAQYGGQQDEVSENENKSNVINSPLNTNLSIDEEIRYFDKNNLPVGSGPLPPQVGETSYFRVYWELTNNLHEIQNTEVVLSLPSYVSFADDEKISVGDLYFDDLENEVIWEVGRLPASVNQVEASFLISLTPNELDRNKILVLSPGAYVTATDTQTKEQVSDDAGAKTTKLEDDEIAALSNSGRIE